MVNEIAQEQWANPNPTTVPGLIRMPGPNVQPYQPSPQTTRSLATKGTALAHARMDPTVIAALKESAAHGRGIRSGQLAFDPNTGERISGGARSYADELPMGEFSTGGSVTVMRRFEDGGEVTAGDGSDADKEKQAAEYAAGVKAAQAAAQTAQEQAMVGMLPPSAPTPAAPTGAAMFGSGATAMPAATVDNNQGGGGLLGAVSSVAGPALGALNDVRQMFPGSDTKSHQLQKTTETALAAPSTAIQQIPGEQNLPAPVRAGVEALPYAVMPAGNAGLLARLGLAGASGVSSYGASEGAKSLGASPQVQQIAGLAGGVIPYEGLPRLASAATEHLGNAVTRDMTLPMGGPEMANPTPLTPPPAGGANPHGMTPEEMAARVKAAGIDPTAMLGGPSKPTVYPNGEYSAAARAESPGSIRANVYGDVVKPPAIDPGSAENPLRGLINIADGSSPNAKPAPLAPAPVEAGGATAPSPVAEPVTSSAGSSPPVSPGAAELPHETIQQISKATGLGIGTLRNGDPQSLIEGELQRQINAQQMYRNLGNDYGKSAAYGSAMRANALQKALDAHFPESEMATKAAPVAAAAPGDMARPLGLATDIQAVPAPLPAELDARIASGRPASRGATVAPAEAGTASSSVVPPASGESPVPSPSAPSGLANITLADLVDALSKRAEGATAGPVPKEGELTPTEVSRAAKSEIGNLQTSWEKYNGLSDSELISQADAVGVRPAGTAPLTPEGKMDPAYRDQLTGALAMKEASPPPAAERSIAEQIAARQPTVEQQMTEMLDKLFGPDAPMGRMNPELDRHLAIEESGKVADNLRNWEKQPVGATGGGAPPPNVGDRVMAGSGGGPGGQDRTLAQVFRDTGASTLDNLRAATNVPMSFLLNAHTTSFKAGVGQQMLHPMNALAAMKGLVEGALHPDVAASYFEGARNNPMLNASIDPRVAPISADIFNKGGNKGIGLFQSQHGNAVMAELRDPDLAFQGKSWIDRNIIEKIPGRERTSAAITNQMNIIRAANYATEANRLWNALGKPDMSLPENAKLIGQFKDIAEVINHGTGRGDINPFSYKGVNVGMGGRSWVARVQMPLDVVFRNEAGVGPKTFNPLGSGARPLAMRQLLATAGFAAGMTTMSKAMADQAGLNVVPQSLNPVANLPFGAGKFIVNNAAGTGRVSNDFTQGFGPMLRFVGNVAEAVHSGDGEALQNTVLEYLRNEATNPAASKAIDVATGKDWKGDPLPGQPGFNPKGISDRAREQFMQVVKHPGEAAFSTLTPLGVQEIVKAIQEVGPAGAVLALPGLGASSVSATPISLGSQIYDAQQQVADSGNKLLANPDWLQSQIAANGVDKNKGMPPETAQALQRGLADGSLNYFNVGPHVQQLIRDELAQSDPAGLQRLDALVKQRGDPFEVQREYKDKIQSTVGVATDQKAMDALKNGPSDLGLYKGTTRQSFSSVVSSEYKDVQAQIAKGKDTPEYQDALTKSQEKAKGSAANPDRAPNVISQMLNDYYSLGDKFTKTDGTFDYPGYQGAVNKMLLDAHAKNPDMAELLAFNIQKDKTQDWQVRQELAKVQPVVDAYYGNRDKNPGTQNAWRASNPKEDAILWYAGYVPDVRSSAAYNYGMRLVEGGSRRPTMATTGIRGQ